MDKKTSKSIKKLATNDFKYILVTYIKPFFSLNFSLELNQLKEEKTVKTLITFNKKEESYTFYPCRKNPMCSYTVFTDDKSVNIKPACKILEEVMKVSQYNYTLNNCYKKQYYDLSIDEGNRFNFVYRYKRYDLAYEIGLCNW